jgi:hypothetical protein
MPPNQRSSHFSYHPRTQHLTLRTRLFCQGEKRSCESRSRRSFSSSIGPKFQFLSQLQKEQILFLCILSDQGQLHAFQYSTCLAKCNRLIPRTRNRISTEIRDRRRTLRYLLFPWQCSRMTSFGISGVVPVYTTTLKDSGIMICPIRFPDATLYVVTAGQSFSADYSQKVFASPGRKTDFPPTSHTH